MYSYISKRGVLVVVLFLLATGLVQAFGVSAPYIPDNQLLVNPGKAYTYTITVQNGDEEGYFVKINYTNREIVSLSEQMKYIYSKTYNTTFTFVISVPNDSLAGTEYDLEYTARPMTNESDAVSIGVEIKRNLKIVVTDENGNIPLLETEESDNKFSINKLLTKTFLKYTIIIIGLILGVFVVIRLWNISHKISTEIRETKPNHTIRESKNIHELHALLKKMSEEEFELNVIKHAIKDKLSEIGEHSLAHQTMHLNKSDLLKKLSKNDK